MTPKQQAKELIDKFTFRKVDGTIVRFDRTKQCALTCIGVMEKKLVSLDEYFDLSTYSEYLEKFTELHEIRQEIEKL